MFLNGLDEAQCFPAGLLNSFPGGTAEPQSGHSDLVGQDTVGQNLPGYDHNIVGLCVARDLAQTDFNPLASRLKQIIGCPFPNRDFFFPPFLLQGYDSLKERLVRGLSSQRLIQLFLDEFL